MINIKRVNAPNLMLYCQECGLTSYTDYSIDAIREFTMHQRNQNVFSERVNRNSVVGNPRRCLNSGYSDSLSNLDFGMKMYTVWSQNFNNNNV